jgi:hypothetical protein
VATDENSGRDQRDLGARLGRAAGRFVKQAKPRAQRIASDAKPLVEKATQYAVEHQDELKAAGAKVLRSRIAGPWGMALDAVANAAGKATSNDEAPSSPTCDKCGAENPRGSKFCNQCASPLDARSTTDSERING